MGRPAIYQKSSRKLREEASERFAASGMRDIQREMQRMKASARREAGRMKNAYQKGKSLDPVKTFQALTGSRGFAQFARDVRRYSRGGLRPLLQSLFDRLGPSGKILKAILGFAPDKSRGTSKMLGAAVDLLRAFGYEVLPPADESVDSDDEQRADRAAQEWLDRKKRRPTTRKEYPQEGPQPTKEKPARKDEPVSITDSRGRSRRFPANHPIVTGAFIRTPNSTNVYEVGYDADKFDLFVRFQDDKGGPGSMYRYAQVTPEQYLGFYRYRNQGDRSGTGRGYTSPGTFVWGQLRIRGTISGHQKDYELTSVTGGNVPRKATMTGQGEAFMPRNRFKDSSGNVFSSSKPFQLVRPTAFIERTQPNRGTPKSPNRGRPNNGGK